MKNKVIFIGIDGFDFEYLRINLSEFIFVEKLIEKGIFAPLKSTIPPTTFPAWTSMMSGFNPGKTGIYEFYKLGEKSKLINSASVNIPRIWDVFSQNNLKCIVLECLLHILYLQLMK